MQSGTRSGEVERRLREDLAAALALHVLKLRQQEIARELRSRLDFKIIFAAGALFLGLQTTIGLYVYEADAVVHFVTIVTTTVAVGCLYLFLRRRPWICVWTIGELGGVAHATSPVTHETTVPDRRKRLRVVEGGKH